MYFIEIEAIAIALHAHMPIAATTSVTFQSFTYEKSVRNFGNFFFHFTKHKLPGLMELPTTTPKNNHKLQENMTTFYLGLALEMYAFRPDFLANL